MATPMEDAELKQGLIEDYAQAKQTAEQGAASRGSGLEEQEFSPRAIKTKDRTIARKELANLKSRFDETINELASQANFADSIEENKFRINMDRKFKKFQMATIQQAIGAKRQAAKDEIDAEKASQMSSALGKLISNTASSIIQGLGAKEDPPAGDATNLSMSQNQQVPRPY